MQVQGSANIALHVHLANMLCLPAATVPALLVAVYTSLYPALLLLPSAAGSLMYPETGQQPLHRASGLEQFHEGLSGDSGGAMSMHDTRASFDISPLVTEGRTMLQQDRNMPRIEYVSLPM